MTAAASRHRPSVFVPAAVAAFVASACGPDGAGSATSIAAAPDSVALRGTSTTTIEVDANGAWTAEAAAPWLSIEPSAGDGDATVTITADRSGLEVEAYAGSILFTGGPATAASLPVLMRFPEIAGTVSDAGGNLQLTSARRALPRLRPGEDYAPGRILVGLDRHMIAYEETGRPDASAVSRAALERAAARLGDAVAATDSAMVSPTLGLAALTVPDADVAGAVATLRRNGRARYAEPDVYLHPNAAPNDAFYDKHWHYRNINLEAAWNITSGYERSTIAVIDGDLYPDHPDLADNLLPGYDFVAETRDISINREACASHGSHVAGTVAAVTGNGSGVAGIAGDSRVLPLSIALPTGENCGLQTSALVRAITYAAGDIDLTAGALDEPVDVINMSLSGPDTDSKREAVEFAVSRGVTLVAAAGNDGEGVIPSPAKLPQVIAVSATDLDDDIAPYSNFGSEVFVAAPGGDVSQVFGEGEDERPAGVLSTIWSYDNDRYSYSYKQGTSMASPHVAGVAALLHAVNPGLTPDDVADILAATAVDLGSPGRDPEFGYGLVDAGAAVALAAERVEVAPDEVVVRLRNGSGIVASTFAGTGGSFDLGAVAAGEYTLEAGNLRDGELGVEGTLYGSAAVTIDYSGDVSADLPLALQ